MLVAIVCVLAGDLLGSIPSAYLLTPAAGAFSANRSRQRRASLRNLPIWSGTPTTTARYPSSDFTSRTERSSTSKPLWRSPRATSSATSSVLPYRVAQATSTLTPQSLTRVRQQVNGTRSGEYVPVPGASYSLRVRLVAQYRRGDPAAGHFLGL